MGLEAVGYDWLRSVKVSEWLALFGQRRGAWCDRDGRHSEEGKEGKEGKVPGD